jgi:hypothetical protein
VRVSGWAWLPYQFFELNGRYREEHRAPRGHLRPLMPKNNHDGNGRSQSAAAVARRRKHSEGISQAARQRLTPPSIKRLIERPLVKESKPRYRPNPDMRPTITC